MSGRQHEVSVLGANYQNAARSIIGRVASMVEVPRQDDYGIDFYCHPLTPIGARTVAARDLCGLQVKGGGERLEYGGLDKSRAWREHELVWLKTLAVPLYLARVDASFEVVELFSLWSFWCIFWRLATHPFRIVVVTRPAADAPCDWIEPQPAPDPNGRGHGDGMVWTVNVGPPIVRLTHSELGGETFRSRVVDTLRMWISSDRLTLMHFHQFIPRLDGITRWRPNVPVPLEGRVIQFYDENPGANLARLSQSASAGLVNLGLHLEGQKDPASMRLIPILEWLNARPDYSDPISRQLLERLRKAEERSKESAP